MAVAFDSVATPVIAYPQTTVSVSHTVGGGSDRIVLAFVEGLGGGSHPFDVFTYDGVAMTQLDQLVGAVFGATSTITVWYMLEADLPAAGTYDFDYRTSGAYASIASVISYSGVTQAAPPFATFTSSIGGGGTGVDFDTDITPSASPGILVDFAGGGSTAIITGTPGASQTVRVNSGDPDEYLFCSEKTYTTTALNNLSWAVSANYYTSLQLVAELAEAGGGGGGSTPNAIMFGANF